MVTLVITLGVHGAGNLMNTYFDFVNGVDVSGGTSDTTLVDKALQPAQVCVNGGDAGKRKGKRGSD